MISITAPATVAIRELQIAAEIVALGAELLRTFDYEWQLVLLVDVCSGNELALSINRRMSKSDLQLFDKFWITHVERAQLPLSCIIPF